MSCAPFIPQEHLRTASVSSKKRPSWRFLPHRHRSGTGSILSGSTGLPRHAGSDRVLSGWWSFGDHQPAGWEKGLRNSATPDRFSFVPLLKTRAGALFASLPSARPRATPFYSPSDERKRWFIPVLARFRTKFLDFSWTCTDPRDSRGSLPKYRWIDRINAALPPAARWLRWKSSLRKTTRGIRAVLGLRNSTGSSLRGKNQRPVNKLGVV